MDLRRMRDRAHYVRVLQAFDGFLAAWEASVTSALPRRWAAWLQARSRRPFLLQDLQWLGAGPRGQDIELPSLATPAAAWGSIYVMEGSALGGQVITRVLAGEGIHPHNGAAYFHGWGEATGAHWREVRELLERELAEPRALAQACDAARGTFDTLSALLEGNLHERAAAA
jgi:heme oxygenase